MTHKDTNFAVRNVKIGGFGKAIDFGDVYFITLDNVRVEYCTTGFDCFQGLTNSVVLNQVAFYECGTSCKLVYGAVGWTFNSCTFEGYTKLILAECVATTLNSCYFEYVKTTGGNLYNIIDIGNQIVYPTSLTINSCLIVGDITIGVIVYGCKGLIINGLNMGCLSYGIRFSCEADDDVKKEFKISGLRFYNRTTSQEDPVNAFFVLANGNTTKDVTTVADTNYLMQLTKPTKVADNDVVKGILNDDDLGIGDIITWNYGEIRAFKRKRNNGTVVKGAVQETIPDTTENRPTNLKPIGYMYFDTTLNKPIWWDGTKWIDSTGTAV